VGFKVGDIIDAADGFVLGCRLFGSLVGRFLLGNHVLGASELGEKEINEQPSPKWVDSLLLLFSGVCIKLPSRITSPPHERVYDPNPFTPSPPLAIIMKT